MRYLALAACVVVIGCQGTPVPPTVPAAVTELIGGISDTQPYIGRLAPDSAPNESIGEFALSSCGCGSWRAVVAKTGTRHRQLEVRFYAEGPYEPTGVVRVDGAQDGYEVNGIVDQGTGTARGQVQADNETMLFFADRSPRHSARATTCTMCHFGEDPVWPLHNTHPVYQLSPQPDCLRCHSLD